MIKDNTQSIEHDVKVEHFQFISNSKNLRTVSRCRRQRTRNLLLQVEQELKTKRGYSDSYSDLSTCASTTSSSFGDRDEQRVDGLFVNES